LEILFQPTSYCKYIGWCSNISKAVPKKLTNILKLFKNCIHAIQKLENTDRIYIVWDITPKAATREKNYEESGAFIKDAK